MGYGHHIRNIPFGCQLCASGRFSRMGRPRLERLAPPHALASSPSLSLFSFLFLTDFFRRRTRRTRGQRGRRAANPGGDSRRRGRRLRAAAGGDSRWRGRRVQAAAGRRIPASIIIFFSHIHSTKQKIGSSYPTKYGPPYHPTLIVNQTHPNRREKQCTVATG